MFPSLDRGLAQRWARIIPVALIMYTISFVDRTNISLALPHMSHDLRLNPAQAGSVAGIFYWGYLALQVPGGYLAKRWSAKKLIAILMIAWGISAAGCGLVQNGRELLLMRVLLGVAEGGVFPATLILLSHWFLRAERARANAFWLLCLPGALIVSSPISGWILDRWNWRVMMLAEGILPLAWLAIWLLTIEDRPEQAKWLSGAEREALAGALRNESAGLGAADRRVRWRDFGEPQVLLLIAVYFCFASGQMGLLFWLPSAMEKASKLSNSSAGWLFTIPFIIGAASLVIVARHADKRRERRRHVAAAMMTGGVCILLAVACSTRWPALAFALVACSGISAYGPMGPFWAIPTETLPANIVGSAMGLVNGIGNLGAWAAPVIVGYLDKRTGSFLSGFAFLGVITCVGAGLALLLGAAPAPGAVGGAAEVMQ